VALDLYRQYGAPPYPANFNIYKRIGLDLYASRSIADKDGADSYQLWAALRDMYFGLCETLSTDGTSPAVIEEFGLLLLIAHYYAVRAAALPHKQLADIAAKVAVAMLRHSDVIPADKESLATQICL
jgi:intraflagellar transport protein 172